jgi:hypothetical protein
MDRGGLKEQKIAFDYENNVPICKEHGTMNAVARIEKNGKTYLWYRCLRCRIGVGYDLNPKTNQEYLLNGKKKPIFFDETSLPLPHHAFFTALKNANIPFMVVGSFALKVHGFSIQPQDIDVVVSDEDFEKAENIAKRFEGCEVFKGEVRKEIISPADFVSIVLSNHMFDDLYLQKIARHALDDERIMKLFENTEIMFVLESMVKEMKQKIERGEKHG